MNLDPKRLQRRWVRRAMRSGQTTIGVTCSACLKPRRLAGLGANQRNCWCHPPLDLTIPELAAAHGLPTYGWEVRPVEAEKVLTQ